MSLGHIKGSLGTPVPLGQETVCDTRKSCCSVSLSQAQGDLFLELEHRLTSNLLRGGGR